MDLVSAEDLNESFGRLRQLVKTARAAQALSRQVPDRDSGETKYLQEIDMMDDIQDVLPGAPDCIVRHFKKRVRPN